MKAITDFAAAVKVELANIKEDEVNLAKQISDLKDQIAAGASTLTSEDQAALDAVTASAKAIADSVPDLPTPPTV